MTGTQTQRFNGAAGVNPRMAAKLQAHPGFPAQMLQWGRGCEPADGSQGGVEDDDTHRLQWGRGCEPADGIGRAMKEPWNAAASMGPRV